MRFLIAIAYLVVPLLAQVEVKVSPWPGDEASFQKAAEERSKEWRVMTGVTLRLPQTPTEQEAVRINRETFEKYFRQTAGPLTGIATFEVEGDDILVAKFEHMWSMTIPCIPAIPSSCLASPVSTRRSCADPWRAFSNSKRNDLRNRWFTVVWVRIS